MWDKWYNLAKKYYDEHGDLLVPRSYKTKGGSNLGSWIDNQRTAYQNRFKTDGEVKNGRTALSDLQVELLKRIGMVFDNVTKEVIDKDWNHMYDLAKAYYEEHGNLLVSKRYKTENGENLGIWICTQRVAYQNRLIPKEERTNKRKPLTDAQVEKLLQIGMVFETKNPKSKVEILCALYGLDYQKYEVFRKTSYELFLAKVKYLEENGLPIVFNGEPNTVFFIPEEEFLNGLSKEKEHGSKKLSLSR